MSYEEKYNKSLSFVVILGKIAATFNHYTDEVKIILLIISILISVISLTLLILVMYILATRKKLQTSANLLNSSLFLSGLILSAGITPMNIVELSKETQGDVFQAIRAYLTVIYVGLTISCIVTIAIVRAYQLQSMRLPQNPIHKKTLILVLLISFIIIGTYPAIVAYIGTKHGEKGVGSLLLVSLILAFVILLLAYGKIWNEMNKSKNRLKALNNKSSTTSYHQRAAQSIIRVIMAFLVTHILLFTQGALTIYGAFNFEWKAKNEALLNDINVAAMMMASLGGLINPIIYFYTQTDIQRNLREMKLFQVICRMKSSF